MKVPKPDPLPPPKPPATMPDDQDPAVLAAKRKTLANMASSGGRQSTILTAPQGKLDPVGTSPLGASSTIANTAAAGDTFASKTLG